MENESAAQQIDAIIKKHDNWRGEMLSRLRALIKQADPALVEDMKALIYPDFLARLLSTYCTEGLTALSVR
ncbi:MAG TPA: hypothetical protein VFB60_25730 [Ktedonobacteraceae bacterium]|nr:hypothetical protein [Ktedonobacteraceae bacterium]